MGDEEADERARAEKAKKLAEYKLADVEDQNRAYEREIKNVEDSLMSEKERTDLLGKEGSRHTREADSQLRKLKEEADATRSKASQIKAELETAQKELEQLRSILSTNVRKR